MHSIAVISKSFETYLNRYYDISSGVVLQNSYFNKDFAVVRYKHESIQYCLTMGNPEPHNVIPGITV